MCKILLGLKKGRQKQQDNTEKGLMQVKNKVTGECLWLFPDQLEEEENLHASTSVPKENKYDIKTECQNRGSPEIRERIRKREDLKEIREQKDEQDQVILNNLKKM